MKKVLTKYSKCVILTMRNVAEGVNPKLRNAYIIVTLVIPLYRMRTMTTAYFDKIQIRESNCISN